MLCANDFVAADKRCGEFMDKVLTLVGDMFMYPSQLGFRFPVTTTSLLTSGQGLRSSSELLQGGTVIFWILGMVKLLAVCHDGKILDAYIYTNGILWGGWQIGNLYFTENGRFVVAFVNTAHSDIQDFALNILPASGFHPSELGEFELAFPKLDVVIT